MGQYRLWLQHREVDQNLRRQHITYQQKLSEIEEQIACLEKTARQSNNALLTALMQQLNKQEHPTSVVTATIETQPEHNGAIPESMNGHQYQTLPPSNSGSQDTPVSPPLLAWSHLPNFDTQDISITEEEIISADVIPVLPEESDHLLPSDFSTLFEREPQENVQPSLPWWLRNIMGTPDEDQQSPQSAFIDQQRIHANQRVERWFARRTRLIHFNKWQEGQKK